MKTKSKRIELVERDVSPLIFNVAWARDTYRTPIENAILCGHKTVDAKSLKTALLQIADAPVRAYISAMGQYVITVGGEVYVGVFKGEVKDYILGIKKKLAKLREYAEKL